MTREESTKLSAQLETMRQLYDTSQLQLREKQTACSTSSGSSSSSGLPEELASARRLLKQVRLLSGCSWGGTSSQLFPFERATPSRGIICSSSCRHHHLVLDAQATEALTAEKEHSMQYRLLAEAAEKERDEQLRLSAEVKAAHDASLQRAEEGKREAMQQMQAVKAVEEQLRSDLEEVRAALVAARRAADEAQVMAADAVTAKEEAAVAQAAALAAMKIELAAAKDGEERAQARYRSELSNHAYDMQELSAAKQAQLDAEAAREEAQLKVAELTAEMEVLRSTLEERSKQSSEQVS